MRKRLLSALLACVFILSMLPVSVLAAGELEIAASEVTLAADGTGDVEISLPVNPGMMTMSLAVQFPDALELTSVDDAKLLKNGVLQNNYASPFYLTFGDDLSTENDTSTGTIATLHFKAADGAADGSYAIEIINVTVVDINADDVAYVVKNGSVTIGGDTGDSTDSGNSGDVGDSTDSGNSGSGGTNTPSANGLQIAASEATAAAGATADVEISLPANPGMMTMSLAVQFPAALELTGADDAKLLKNGVLQNNYASPFYLTFGDDLSTENETATGTIATLHFKTPADAANGASYAIEIVNVTVVDINADDVAYSVKNGSVTVAAPAAPTEYDITYPAAENGNSVTGPAKAKEGDTVTLNVTVADNYELTALSFNGTDILAAKSFTMPAGNVTVAATFTQKPAAPTEYDITYPAAENGNSVTGPAKAKEGDTVTLNVTVADNYDLTALSFNGTDILAAKSFTMPAGNVTVAATFTQKPAAPTEYDITYPAAENGNSVTGPAKAKEGDTVTLNVTVADNYDLTALSFNGTDILATKSFTMPAGNVTITATFTEKPAPVDPEEPGEITGGGGCYVATAVYGSYDCPQVWTLRRFRDNVLAETWYGRLFIKAYYAVSPTCVKLFGDTEVFQNFFRSILDPWVADLQENGFESTPYNDIDW